MARHLLLLHNSAQPHWQHSVPGVQSAMQLAAHLSLLTMVRIMLVLQCQRRLRATRAAR
jgi:hypothetical protein